MRMRWSRGTPALHRAIEAAMADPEQSGASLLAESKHRRNYRIDLPEIRERVVVKEFLPPSRHRRSGRRFLEGLRVWVGRSSADQEWSRYEELRETDVPIPLALAYGRASDGRAWIVTRFIPDAVPLHDRLAGYPFEKRRRMREVGELVHRLHSAGFSHRDLHVGNVLVSEKGIWLVDLQRAQPFERKSDRIADVASLDFSLHHADVPLAMRLRFRIAALGLGQFRVAAERQLLREVGRASHRHAVAFYADRTRRTLREGAGFHAVETAGLSGMRCDDCDATWVSAMLAAHRGIVERGGPARLKCDHRSNVTRVEVDGRSAIVKEVVKTSRRKRLADVFRGSPGRRAWLAGHGLRLRGIGAARPLAFLEQRSGGVPVASLVFLEDLGDAPCLSELGPERAREANLPQRLLDLLRRLHRAEVVHGDLQSQHLHLVEGRPALIDLESVRFLDTLHDRHRIKMLSELNASLSSEVLPAAERCDLLDRYLLALPFDRGNRRAVERIVRDSLERSDRWRGEGCELSRRFGGS